MEIKEIATYENVTIWVVRIWEGNKCLLKRYFLDRAEAMLCKDKFERNGYKVTFGTYPKTGAELNELIAYALERLGA